MITFLLLLLEAQGDFSPTFTVRNLLVLLEVNLQKVWRPPVNGAYGVFNLSYLSTLSLQQLVNYNSGFPTQHWFLQMSLPEGFYSSKLILCIYLSPQFLWQQFAL